MPAKRAPNGAPCSISFCFTKDGTLLSYIRLHHTLCRRIGLLPGSRVQLKRTVRGIHLVPVGDAELPDSVRPSPIVGSGDGSDHFMSLLITLRNRDVVREKRSYAMSGILITDSCDVILPINPNAPPPRRKESLRTAKSAACTVSFTLQSTWRHISIINIRAPLAKELHIKPHDPVALFETATHIIITGRPTDLAKATPLEHGFVDAISEANPVRLTATHASPGTRRDGTPTGATPDGYCSLRCAVMFPMVKAKKAYARDELIVEDGRLLIPKP